MAGLSKLLQDEPIVRKQDVSPSVSVKKIHYSKLVTGKYQYRDKNKTQEELHEEAVDLSVSIELAGGLLEYPLVRKVDTDEYEIISGHTRVRACKYLVEELGKEEFAFIPCHVRVISDQDANYYTSSGNIRKPSTQAEIMHEIENERARANAIKDENVRGRLVERLAQRYGKSASVIGEYITISKNISDKGRQAFEDNVLNKSAALELSSLPQSEQDELLEAGVTKKKDIKAYKEEKTVYKDTITNTVKNSSSNKEEDDTKVVALNTDDVVDVLPGQYCVVNADMDIEETTTSVVAVKEIGNNDKMKIQERCTCANCKFPSRIEDTFKFYNKGYCTNCLLDLIKDLADTGVITLDYSAVDIEGIIVHS